MGRLYEEVSLWKLSLASPGVRTKVKRVPQNDLKNENRPVGRQGRQLQNLGDETLFQGRNP